MSHDERRYRRHELPPLSVWVRVGEENHRHQLLDLSLGGASIGTVDLPALGAEVELVLAHASWNEPVQISACVIHHRFADDDPNRPVAMGVEFLEHAGDGEQLLADVLALLERAPELGNPETPQTDPDTPVGRLDGLRVEVQRAVALIMVLQREIDSYEEVDAQRRALTEHLLLEHRILKVDGPPISAETATRVEQTREAIVRLEKALAQPLDPSLVDAATAEVVAIHKREIQRAHEASGRTTELSARLTSEPEALEQQIADQRLAIEQLRERIQRERHGWQVAINADLDCIAAINDETEVLRQERTAAAEQHRLWLEGQNSELERLTRLAGGELATGQELARQRDTLQVENEALQATVRSLTGRTLELAAETSASVEPTVAAATPVELTAVAAPIAEPELPPDQLVELTAVATPIAEPELTPEQPVELTAVATPIAEPELPTDQPVELTADATPVAEPELSPEQPVELTAAATPTAEPELPTDQPVELTAAATPTAEPELPPDQPVELTAVAAPPPSEAGPEAGFEMDLTDAAEIEAEPPTPATPPPTPPPSEKPPSEAKARRTFALRLLRGGRLRPTPRFVASAPVEPTEVAVSVLLQQTDIWEELLAAAPPGMRETIAQRVFELYRDGSIEILGGEERKP